MTTLELLSLMRLLSAMEGAKCSGCKIYSSRVIIVATAATTESLNGLH